MMNGISSWIFLKNRGLWKEPSLVPYKFYTASLYFYYCPFTTDNTTPCIFKTECQHHSATTDTQNMNGICKSLKAKIKRHSSRTKCHSRGILELLKSEVQKKKMVAKWLR